MITRSALCLLMFLTFQSCALPDNERSQEREVGPARRADSLVPGGDIPPAPMLVGETIDCDRFVSPEGDDSSSGSESKPWRSFQLAANSTRPGETVCFRGGDYLVKESVRITQSGRPEASIVFIAYPGERPILDGGGEVGDLLIVDQDASHLRISGFTLRNFRSWGIDVSGGNRFVQLDHLTVEGGESGVHFTYGADDRAPPEGGPVDHITLEESLIYGSEYTGVDCTPGPCTNMIFRRVEVYGSGRGGEASFGADGIAISRGSPVLVEDCYIHDNGGDGIDLNSRDQEGYAAGVIVRRNHVAANFQNGIKLWAGGRIENNLVWGHGNSALWLGTFHSDLEVVNNTVAFNMWDPTYSDRNWAFSAGYPEEIIADPQVHLLLVNNIFAFNTGPDVGDPTGIFLGPGVKLTEHHNLFFSNVEGEITAEYMGRDFTRLEIREGVWSNLTGQGSNTLGEDPLFVSGWPQVQLQLRANSPAIDAGHDVSCPEEDSLGNPRPMDGDNDGEAQCDIGAIEWHR